MQLTLPFYFPGYNVWGVLCRGRRSPVFSPRSWTLLLQSGISRCFGFFTAFLLCLTLSSLPHLGWFSSSYCFSDRVPVSLRTCLFRPAYCGVWQFFLLWTPPASASRLQDCLVWCQFYCFSRAYDVPWLGVFSDSFLGFSCSFPELQITQYGWALFSYQFTPIRVFPF